VRLIFDQLVSLVPAVSAFTFSSLVSALVWADEHPNRLLWGDVHLHSNLSWDAYYSSNESAGVDDAYRYAKGLPVVHPYHRAKVQIDRPLDFLAVTDHAEFLGLPYRLLSLSDTRLSSTRLGEYLHSIYAEETGTGAKPGVEALISMILAFQTSMLPPPDSDEENAATRFPPPPPQVSPDLIDWLLNNRDMWPEFYNFAVMKDSWQTIIESADNHNDPGTFTTLIGWEYSAQANGGNLHRVVLTPADQSIAGTFRPFSFLDSDNPEDLWDWLDATRSSTGADFTAIPHNSNLSMGGMFSRVTFDGRPIDKAYIEKRAKWETVAEVTQVKGTSETHPLLGNDEFAGFEIFSHQLASFKDDPKTAAVTEADFLRSALKTGIELDEKFDSNPFKLGMIGSTDSHTALSSTEENNFHGKYGEGSIPEEAGNPIADFNGYSTWDLSSSGLAAVWAKNNTREEVFAAFKRREVYGTSGPRIGLRFFGGYDFTASDSQATNLVATGYAKGVPMGGDLYAATKAPRFLIHAVKDPAGANLDRVQIIKGWLDQDGKTHEKVIDVVWSGERSPDENGKLPAVGDTVNRDTADYSNGIGSAELTAVWKDPEFNPDQSAFYYLRVLEIPTPRHSLFDAVALKVAPSKDHPEVIQERAWSSPIWYNPGERSD